MEFMKQELINSLIYEVEKLLNIVEIQKNTIKNLEQEVSKKNKQIEYLKNEINDLSEKINNFNLIFNEIPIFNNYEDNIEINKKDSDENKGNEFWVE